MSVYSLTHVKDHVLLRDLTALTAKDRATTAVLLAHIAEVDARRLYAQAGYSAMYHYCIRALGFSEDMASKRIRAARVARRFPFVFDAIADGRLHVTGVSLLSSTLRNLRAKEATDLLTAAEHKTKDEILVVLAERFPQPDVATRVRALPGSPEGSVLSLQVPGTVEVQPSSIEPTPDAQGAPDHLGVVRFDGEIVPRAAVASTSPSFVSSPARTTPLSPGRFALQLTISAETREKLRRADDLLGRALTPGDLAAVLDRALDALIEKLERRLLFENRTSPKPPTASGRHIPAHVRRAVRRRDGDRCTYVSENGVRCEERRALELDHILPVARGGESTVANLRLRCRPHNQLEAEQVFGAGFMQQRREQAH